MPEARTHTRHAQTDCWYPSGILVCVKFKEAAFFNRLRSSFPALRSASVHASNIIPRRLLFVSRCVCSNLSIIQRESLCVFSPHLFWMLTFLSVYVDASAAVAQEEAHKSYFFHSAVILRRLRSYFCGEKGSAVPFPRRLFKSSLVYSRNNRVIPLLRILRETNKSDSCDFAGD